jgi:hypothetical protein
MNTLSSIIEKHIGEDKENDRYIHTTVGYNQAKKEIRDSIPNIVKELVDQIEAEFGEFGKQNGSFGYQGIVMGISSYQMDTDKFRDQILYMLDPTVVDRQVIHSKKLSK